MSIDAKQGERGISENRYYLAYRETLLLSLGFLQSQKLTQTEFYDVYSRLHQRFHHAGIVEFTLPVYEAFQAMIRKLIKIGDLHQTYHDENYVLSLTEQGEGKVDLIMFNLEQHPKLSRIVHIVEYYRTNPVY